MTSSPFLLILGVNFRVTKFPHWKLSKEQQQRGMKQEEEMEGGINLLLIITVVIGTTLMTSLIVCYVCVFRSLCCPSAEELERAHSMMRRGSSRRRFNRPSTIETNVSSQPTEIERV